MNEKKKNERNLVIRRKEIIKIREEISEIEIFFLNLKKSIKPRAVL